MSQPHNIYSSSHQSIAIFVKGWPRLSETFIAQELYGLQEAGLHFDIISLRRPYDQKRHPIHSKIRAKIYYLPEYIYQEPMRFLRAWWNVRRWKTYSASFNSFIMDLIRDFTFNRVRRFAQAIIFAYESKEKNYHFYYSHFLHTPTSVAYYASLLSGVEFAFSAHAKDIWTNKVWDIRKKIARARWGVTCTKFGADYLRGLALDRPDKIHLIYHGLRLGFLPQIKREKSSGKDVLHFLSVGRAVKKKGFDILLKAFYLLPADLQWRWEHIGGGDELEMLQLMAKKMGLSDKIEWRGAMHQEEVFKAYGRADLFILPCRVTEDGDRDGLPNVLMEAASAEVPILATHVSAIPEFITHNKTGYLVDSENENALAEALVKLSKNKKLRLKYAKEAKKNLEAYFTFEKCFTPLIKLFETYIEPVKCQEKSRRRN